MSKRRSLSGPWFLFVALVFLGATAGARAESAGAIDLNIDPAKIRFITPTASSSACIGKPTTPLCGIETLIGCSHYVWNEACESINRRVSPERSQNIRIEYVIVKAGFVNKDRVRAVHARDEAEGLDIGRFPWLSEDAFQAIIFDRTCPASRENCEGVPWQMGLFTVAPSVRVPGNWSRSAYGIFDQESWFVD